MTPDLSIVIPALNEEGSLRQVLPRLKKAFAEMGVKGEILVVNGKSTDKTVEVCEAEGAKVLAQQGRGFGAALREGLLAAAAPWTCVVDADGSHPPEDLKRLWAERERADLVIASRYVAGGGAVMDLQRQILSRSLNIVARLVLSLPAKDSSGGFRLYRSPFAKKAAALSDAPNFTVQQELLVGILRQGGRVIEVPFTYEPRIDGVSKASATALAPAYLRMLAKLRAERNRPV